jgi:predicted DNA binding CopG/RHH family protein
MPGSGDNVARRKTANSNGVSSPTLTRTQLVQKEVKARAVVSKLTKPKFASEAEEAAWYPAHPEYLEALFKQAAKEGKLGRGTAARILGFTKPVTIRLSEEDLEKSRVQAEKKGLRYQTYLKMLLHEALANAEQPQKA